MKLIYDNLESTSYTKKHTELILEFNKWGRNTIIKNIINPTYFGMCGQVWDIVEFIVRDKIYIINNYYEIEI